MLLLLATLARAEEDHLGGEDTWNNQGDMLKLLLVEDREPAVITGMKFTVYNAGWVGGVTLVRYELVGNEYVLRDAVAGTGLPGSGLGVADSGPVSWVLEPGHTYALGAYLEGDWYYYFTQSGSANPWFGEVVGSVRYAADAAPESFQADTEGYYYDVAFTSVSPDGDGDGALAREYGGDDCDDTDPTVGAADAEVPYDGVDQDCDGADLRDVDGDGVDAVQVGGHDCDDEDATVAPTRVDTCGDGVDQDCSGADATCADGSGEPGVDVSPDGCAAAPQPGPAGLVLGAVGAGALVARRRRRGSLGG